MSMLQRPGLRLLLEAAVIVAAAAVAGLLQVGAWGIAATVFVVWVTAALVEYSLGRSDRPKPKDARRHEKPAVEVVAGTSQPVGLTSRGAAWEADTPGDDGPSEPAASLAAELPDEAPAEPIRDLFAPEPAVAGPSEHEHPPVDLPWVADDPAPVESPPREAAAPEPPPQELEPARGWNIWDLERGLRTSGDANEEQEFLLLYLRDFAGPDGLLPVDFDGLVRESFGELLRTPTR